MKLGSALTIAVAIHVAILAALIVNVSLDRPERPQDNPGDLMHATFVPPAKGDPKGGAATKSEPQSAPKAAEPIAEDPLPERLQEQVKKQQEAEQARMQALEQQRAEDEQKALALKKAEAEKKQLEEQKKKLEEENKALELKKAAEAKKKAEQEAKAKAEAEKKKAEEEARKKAEQKKKLEQQKELELKKAEEAKKKAALEAKKQAEAKAKAEANARADSLEDDILGTADGDVENGKGLGQGGSGDAGYGDKIRGMIENNWHVDPSMNGKKVKVTLQIGSDGLIQGENCQGDKAVCDSALNAIKAIGMFPVPPSSCKECSTLVIYMTPRI